MKFIKALVVFYSLITLGQASGLLAMDPPPRNNEILSGDSYIHITSSILDSSLVYLDQAEWLVQDLKNLQREVIAMENPEDSNKFKEYYGDIEYITKKLKQRGPIQKRGTVVVNKARTLAVMLISNDICRLEKFIDNTKQRFKEAFRFSKAGGSLKQSKLDFYYAVHAKKVLKYLTVMDRHWLHSDYMMIKSSRIFTHLYQNILAITGPYVTPAIREPHKNLEVMRLFSEDYQGAHTEIAKEAEQIRNQLEVTQTKTLYFRDAVRQVAPETLNKLIKENTQSTSNPVQSSSETNTIAEDHSSPIETATEDEKETQEDEIEKWEKIIEGDVLQKNPQQVSSKKSKKQKMKKALRYQKAQKPSQSQNNKSSPPIHVATAAISAAPVSMDSGSLDEGSSKKTSRKIKLTKRDIEVFELLSDRQYKTQVEVQDYLNLLANFVELNYPEYLTHVKVLKGIEDHRNGPKKAAPKTGIYLTGGEGESVKFVRYDGKYWGVSFHYPHDHDGNNHRFIPKETGYRDRYFRLFEEFGILSREDIEEVKASDYR